MGPLPVKFPGLEERETRGGATQQDAGITASPSSLCVAFIGNWRRTQGQCSRIIFLFDVFTFTIASFVFRENNTKDCMQQRQSHISETHTSVFPPPCHQCVWRQS